MREHGADIRGAGDHTLRLRPHPVVFGGALGLASFVALVVALLVLHNDLPRATEWRIVLGGAGVALAGFVGPSLRWRRARVELSPDRLSWSLGLVRRQRLDIDLDELRALAVEQGVLGRWLGYATLRVIDATGRERTFLPVGHVDAFRAASARCVARARPRRSR